MPKCGRPGCENPSRPGWFACRPDWMALPKDIRHAIFEAWQSYEGIRSPEYTNAVRRARAFWDNQ